MNTRLLVAAVCILLLPFWFSASTRGTVKDFPGGNPVAYAGHTSTGAYCDCGGPGCFCDQGLSLEGTESVSNQRKPAKQGVTGSRGKAESVDFGQLGLLFALALLFWRLRY